MVRWLKERNFRFNFKIPGGQWSDPGNWVMVLLSSLLIVAFTYFFTDFFEQEKLQKSQKEDALLLGYYSAYALALFKQDKLDPFNQIRGRINQYLKNLGIGNLRYPDNPYGENRDSVPVAKFAQEVAGRLAAHGRVIESAFILGWYGLITTNTPSMRPDFDLCKSVREAGFDENNCKNQFSDNATKKIYFKNLIETVQNQKN